MAEPAWSHRREPPLQHEIRPYYPDDQWEDQEYPPYRGPPMHSPHNGYSSDQASTIMGDAPSYLLEHLATFKVSEESDLLYPADGMRRLLHMEKTTGIWTQKMQLRLERDWALILSHENEDIVEKFPIELIREPTAYTSDDPKELYNNIFIFVVIEDPKGNYTNSTDMHIFQCLRISAKDIVEDMKMCMSGGWGALMRDMEMRRGRERIPPPPQEKAPQPPMANGYRVGGPSYIESPMRGRRSDRSSEGGPVGAHDDASSVSSESYSKDVAILNCCFDDIERFIARLQHTAAATQELERRRRSRKSKKKDIGDGLLSMRAKAPPENEFIEILQKFKLSFNMLGKLRTYIHEPNAPELVHFLFTPLTLIVDASRDSNYGSNLPVKVVSPLLTREAIDLLTNCLSSRETELWQSLGEAWHIPREAWKYAVPPYRPVFSSGWAPELSDEPRDHHQRSEHLHKHHHRHREEMDDYYKGPGSPARYHRNPYSESDVSGSESASGAEGGSGSSTAWLADLRSRGAKIVQVTYPRTANNDKELTVVRGEYLEIIDDSRKWWKCGNSRGQIAHVPHTIVTPFPADGAQDAMGPAPQTDWRKERQGKKGGRSYSSSSSSSRSPSPPPKSSPKKKSSKKPPHPPATPIPVPPPLPPADFTPGNSIVQRPPRKLPVNSKRVFGTSRETSDLMNYELKGVLEEFRKRKPIIDVQKTPDVYIDSKASANEVQEWLKKKNFSDRVCKQFDGVDGEKLFALKKDQCTSFCGAKEGNRLYSQITIQKNVSGFKTTNTNELRRILSEQRKRIETKAATDNVDGEFSFLQNYSGGKTSDQSDGDFPEEIIVRKTKKSKNRAKQSPKTSPAKQKSTPVSPAKTNLVPKQTKPSAAPSSSRAPPAAPKYNGVPPPPSSNKGHKSNSSSGKNNTASKSSKSETGTLKQQIKARRKAILYKTDDEGQR